MKSRLLMGAWLFCLAVMAHAQVTVDGTRNAGENYQNNVTGVNTNTQFGFGPSAKAEQLNAVDDAANLNVFVEGSLFDGNKLFIVIDSDNNPATGFSGIPPTGTYGEGTALSRFSSLPPGGYDLTVVIQANGNPTPTQLNAIVLAYSSGGAVVNEQFVGGPANSLVNSLQFTIRGTTASLGVALVPGDGPANGIEVSIPKAWFLNTSFSGAYKIVTLNGNGGNSFWSNSFIPELNPPASNLGFGSGAGTITNLAPLEAPTFNWLVPVTNPTVVLSTSASDPTSLASIPMTATFSENVTGFAAGDLEVTNGTISGFTAVNGSTYTFNLNPTAAGQASVRVPAGAANGTGSGTPANVQSALFTITYDNVAPQAVLESRAPATTGSNPIKFKVTFSEVMSGLTLGDFVVTNASSVTSTPLTAQSFLINVVPAGNGAVNVTLNAGAATDQAGNPVNAANISRTFNSGATDPTNRFRGQDIFVVGETPGLLGYGTGEIGLDPTLQLRDDGLNGDATAGDGIYTANYLVPVGDGSRKNWKVASAAYSISLPPGLNNSTYRPSSFQRTYFFFDTRTGNSGFVPNPGLDGVDAIYYTSPSLIRTTDVIRAVGSFTSELGQAGDFSTTATNIIMNDLGNNGDLVAGDGIVTLQVTGLPAGSYNYKHVVGAFTFQAGVTGYDTENAYNGNGGGITLPILDPSDVVTLQFNTGTGQYRISSTNPLASQGPPWFAISRGWGATAAAPSNQLVDDGTNGDVTAGDGIYSRSFVVGTPSTTHSLKIAQGIGSSYPVSTDFNNFGGMPYVTTFPGQVVLVQFDTNVRNDGYSPKTRYAWVDQNARRVPTYVQIVGTVLTGLSSGLIDAFSTNATQFALNDGGTTGDVTAGDGLWTLEVPGGPALNDVTLKAVGQQNTFDWQFGGEGDGATFRGNNPAPFVNTPASPTFIVDAVTGRVGVGPTPPTRPATLNAQPVTPNAARSWQLFE